MTSRHPLAGRAIERMNGAGNAILVLDLRGSAARPTPEDARAIHRAPGLGYDQMMVLSDPRRSGNRGRRADLQQRRHARGRLRQRDALRRGPALPRAWARRRHDRDRGRRHRLRASRTMVLPGRHGRAAPRMGRHSASTRRARHAAGETVARRRRSGGARARFRGQHGQPACGVLRARPRAASTRRSSGRGSRSTRCSRRRPMSPSLRFSPATR